MPTKRYSTEQIVSKLRQAEVELSRGLRVPLVCKKLGISEQTYYRWRKEYGGLRLDGIVKLRGIAMIDPQHTWFATGLEPIILGVGQPDSA